MTKRKKFLFIFVPLSVIMLIAVTLGIAFAAPEYLLKNKVIDPYAKKMNYYNDQMSSDKNSEKQKDDIKKKLEPFVEEATKRAQAVTEEAEGKKTPIINKTPIPVHPEKIPDGIEENPLVPPFASYLALNTAWRKTVDNYTYLLFAGCNKKDPSQGVIYMEVQEARFKEFPSPTNSGCLRITGADHLIVTLTTKKGDVLYFDAGLEKFVDPSGNPISTPLPAYP